MDTPLGNSLVIFNADTIIGEAIIRKLQDPDHRRHPGHFEKVYATVRDVAHSGDLMALGVILVEVGDYPDSKKLADCLKYCKTCIIIPDESSDRMGDQAMKLIDCAKQALMDRCVLLSKIGAEDTSIETSKWYNRTEEHLKKSGMSTMIIVRVAPLDETMFIFRSMMAEGYLHWMLKEDAKLTKVSLHDVVHFIAHELLHGNSLQEHLIEPKVFMLTGPQILRPTDFSQIFEKVYGKKIRYEQIGRQEMIHYLRQVAGMNHVMSNAIADIQELVNKGRLDFISDDQKKSTGHEPMKMSEWLDQRKDLFQSECGM